MSDQSIVLGREVERLITAPYAPSLQVTSCPRSYAPLTLASDSLIDHPVLGLLLNYSKLLSGRDPLLGLAQIVSDRGSR